MLGPPPDRLEGDAVAAWQHLGWQPLNEQTLLEGQFWMALSPHSGTDRQEPVRVRQERGTPRPCVRRPHMRAESPTDGGGWAALRDITG